MCKLRHKLSNAKKCGGTQIYIPIGTLIYIRHEQKCKQTNIVMNQLLS